MKRLFLLGDSTCAVKDAVQRPETGWGEMFSAYTGRGWLVADEAVDGMSTSSCLRSGVFSSVFFSAKEGDCCIIQFGHNDRKDNEPWSGYIANLSYMAGQMKRKGVDVFFVTPVPRRCFENARLRDTHGDFVAAMKKAGHDAAVPVLDITLPLMMELSALGDEESRKYYMCFGPGIHPGYPEGREDNTHLSPEGAAFIASFVHEALLTLPSVPPFLKEAETEEDEE